MNTHPQSLGGIVIDDLHGFSIEAIADMPTTRPIYAQELGIRCRHCDTNWFMSTLFMAQYTACEPCCNKHEEDEMNRRAKKYWERICPRQLRLTDTTHENFPRELYAQNRGYSGNTSLFLYGPSGAGKTRTAALLLKRALLHGKTVQFLWPEELKTYAKSHNERLKHIQDLGTHDVLMLDDALLTGAQDERIADFLKDLIDFMQRNQNHMIITSQIGGEDYKEQANKFGNVTKTDLERIEALLRRIRESFTVVPFVSSDAAKSDNDGDMF